MLQKKEQLKNKGNEFFQKKDYLKAIQSYYDALKLGSHDEIDITIETNISLTLLHMKEYEKSKETIAFVIVKNPHHKKAHLIYVKSLIGLKQEKQALKYLIDYLKGKSEHEAPEFYQILNELKKNHPKNKILLSYDVSKQAQTCQTLPDEDQDIYLDILKMFGKEAKFNVEFEPSNQEEHVDYLTSIQEKLFDKFEIHLDTIIKKKIQNPLHEMILKDFKKGFIRSKFYVEEVKNGSLMVDVNSKKVYAVFGDYCEVTYFHKIAGHEDVCSGLILPWNLPNKPPKILLGGLLKQSEEKLNFDAEKHLMQAIEKNQVIYNLFMKEELKNEEKTEEKVCHLCKKSNVKLLKCSKCKTTRYCSSECQKQDWPQHKQTCH